jgi:hypothetical protein
MDLSLKNLFIMGVALFALGFYTSQMFRRPQVVTKYVDRDHIKTNIVTKIKVIKQKDGTIVEEKEVVDNSERDRQIEHVVSETKLRDWNVTALYGAPYNALNERIWGLGVQRRVLGPVFLGVQYNSNKSVLGTISLEF